MKRLFLAVFALSIAAPLFGQTPTRLAFQVASIKQEDVKLPNQITGGVCHGSDMPAQVGIPGMTVALGRCRYVGSTVKQLINNAYDGVAFNRISGGPGWIGSLPFTIDAKAEDGSMPKRTQLMEMMRTLLEDRFKLKFHRELKEVAGYALVVGKNGIKLKESAEGTRPGMANRPGSITGSMSMRSLAGLLTGPAGGPVSDSTGLTTRYDIDLKWSPDLGQPQLTASVTSASDPTGPSIFTAIQELGLRLESQKVSIELFVVDSIEKPSPN
jgi:uncharacterized protein (TIGR03435 family)